MRPFKTGGRTAYAAGMGRTACVSSVDIEAYAKGIHCGCL